MEFENSIIRGIHISRYIASWVRVGGTIGRAHRHLGNSCAFTDWLRTLEIDNEHLTDDEVWQIYRFATNGKLELQESAKRFIEGKGSV